MFWRDFLPETAKKIKGVEIAIEKTERRVSLMSDGTVTSVSVRSNGKDVGEVVRRGAGRYELVTTVSSQRKDSLPAFLAYTVAYKAAPQGGRRPPRADHRRTHRGGLPRRPGLEGAREGDQDAPRLTCRPRGTRSGGLTDGGRICRSAPAAVRSAPRPCAIPLTCSTKCPRSSSV